MVERREALVARLFSTLALPQTVACQGPLSWDFPSKNTGVGCHFLLQGIFPTLGSNLGLPHWRWVLSHGKESACNVGDTGSIPWTGMHHTIYFSSLHFSIICFKYIFVYLFICIFLTLTYASQEKELVNIFYFLSLMISSNSYHKISSQ